MGDILADALAYFTYCPLCHRHGTIIPLESEWSGIGGKDHLICSGCGAKWHIKPGKWAKLVKTSGDGGGKEYLEKKHNLEFWQKMAYERKINRAIEKAPIHQPSS